MSTGAQYKEAVWNMAGDALTTHAWERNMGEAARIFARILKPQGVFALFIDWRNGGLLQDALRAAGLKVRGQVVWDKSRASRPYRGRFRMQAEYVIWGGERLPRGDIYLDGVLRATTKTNGKRHITEKPLALMEQLVLPTAPGGLILDPFAGSGTTGVAAIRQGYRFHGMEMVPAYFRVSVDRLTHEARGPAA